MLNVGSPGERGPVAGPRLSWRQGAPSVTAEGVKVKTPRKTQGCLSFLCIMLPAVITLPSVFKNSSCLRYLILTFDRRSFSCVLDTLSALLTFTSTEQRAR